jgi:2,4-dienoyl-CoA reductase (NADPH2)
MTPSVAATLFSPFTVGKHRLKNRLVALPVYTGYAHPGGRVSRLLLEHYVGMARSGAAMVVVANTAVSQNGILSNYTLRIDDDAYIPGLAKLAKAIKSRGALACLQLNHGGRFAKTARPLLPSSMNKSNLTFNVISLKNFMNFFPFERRTGLTRRFLTMAGSWSRTMSETERKATIEDFGSAAHRAWRAGFDMIELHGAGGYLISQFLSSFSNKHGREHGEAFLFELLNEVKRQLPRDFPVGYRLIIREWVPDGIDLDDALNLARKLETKDVAYLSASVGTYNSMFSAAALKFMDAPGYLQADMEALTRATQLPTIISGRITSPALAHKIISQGSARLIGLGRVLRADPRWIVKAADPGAKIKTCINCNWCLKRVVLDQGFNCTRWSKKTREKIDLEYKLLSRNYRSLLIAAEYDDLNRLQWAFPYLLPQPRALTTAPVPTLLVFRPRLNDTEQAAWDKATMKLVDTSGHLFQQQGIAGARLHVLEQNPKGPLDMEIHQQAILGNNGLIVIPRVAGQLWRDKVAFRERQKIVALMGHHRRMAKMLVPIDMSISSLLVLMFFQQAFGNQKDLSADFCHVMTEHNEGIEKRWVKAKRLVGFKKDTPLHIRPPQGNVVQTLVAQYQNGGYDTIIMGRRGISRIKYMLLGSVSAGILRRLPNETIILVD